MSSTTKKYTSKASKLVVAAIDFGTTYSGYAFSFKHDYEKDPTKISTNSTWVAGTAGLLSLKTPTVILLDADKNFVAFGYEAEDLYNSLAVEGGDLHKKYYYYRRFKMLLYNVSNLQRKMELEDEHGKTMPAILVFSMAIKYLKQHLMGTLNNRTSDITDNDVQWVLTVPAIWNDGSKQFMREAAEMAGIKKENLIIALEPEAASLFCMHLPVDKMMFDKTASTMSISPFAKGTKYMVVDVGGGTVDITIHEVLADNKLKELSGASGGAWGGTMVDRAFADLLSKIVGEKVYDAFKKEATEDVIDLYREFETKKRSIRVDKTTKETIKIPVRLSDMYTLMTKKVLKNAVAENKELGDKVVWTADKMRVDADVMKSWFNESCKNTVNHVKELFKSKASAGVNTILLVGGFSESPMLQSYLKDNFKDKRIIIPEEAGLAVLKGAVIFGHNPVTIVSRIAKYSYGIRVYRDFQEGVHPANKKKNIGSKVKCQDVFALHVKKGQELVVGQAQSSQRYTPLEDDQLSLVFDIYTSTEENPSYVTDYSCTYVGQLEVDVPNVSGEKERGVWVNMTFGGTEVTVEAKEEKSGKISKASFDFLQ